MIQFYVCDHNQPPVIQSLWIGEKLSNMEQLCITSFLKNGHSFHLYVYGNVNNVPEGTILKDASEIISRDRIFKYKDRDTHAGFANLFRYKLLFEKGGYWVDTDVVSLRPFENQTNYVFAKTKRRKFFGNLNQTFRIQNCIIKAPPGSEIMKYCYETSQIKNPQELRFGETGPLLLRAAVKKFNLDNFVAGAWTFCPIDWSNWGRLISGSTSVIWLELIKMVLYRTRAVHLWNEMWRENHVDKNAVFPYRCIYEQLKRRYPNTSR